MGIKLAKIESSLAAGEILGFQNSPHLGIDLLDGQQTNSIAFASKRA